MAHPAGSNKLDGPFIWCGGPLTLVRAVTSPPPLATASPVTPCGRLSRRPRRRQAAWSGQRPKSSTVWSTEVKPASAATRSAHCSMTRPSTSTLVPQTAAGQVMVVTGGLALPVQSLARRVADRVDHALLAEYLQVTVDGGKADGLALTSKLGVDLLGAAEAGEADQGSGDGRRLPRPAHPRAARLIHCHTSQGSRPFCRSVTDGRWCVTLL